MSGFLVGLLVILELVGFTAGQKSLEGLSGRFNISDPFDVGNVQGKEVSAFGVEVLGGDQEDLSIQQAENISILQIMSFPKDVSRTKPKVLADAAYIYDISSSKVLFSKNPEKIRPIASVTKIMTALIVMEEKDLDEVVTVDPAASWVTGSKMYLFPNEKIKVKELVYSMLIKSANDAAKALEAHYGKDELVALMNEKA